MRRFEILEGDAIEQLRQLPAESVHCVVTSPPYWGLRDYGTAKWLEGDPECEHRVGGQRVPRIEPILVRPLNAFSRGIDAAGWLYVTLRRAERGGFHER